MEHQFTKSNCIQCEFREWDGVNKRSKVCSDEAKRYKRKDGRRFVLIKGGDAKSSNKNLIRLCTYHYEEITKCIDLEEAVNERQFS